MRSPPRQRGHKITLFEAAGEIGGQFNLASVFPARRNSTRPCATTGAWSTFGVDLRLGVRADAAALKAEGFDAFVVATGVAPRTPDVPGIGRPSVVGYIDAICGRAPIGRRVAIMGAGGIGFDVAELITHAGPSGALDRNVFAREWGIDFENHPRGGVTGVTPIVASSGRQVTLMQRKADALGKSLGRTTGWTHRATLQRRGVGMVGGVEYVRIDDTGLHVRLGGEDRLLEVDTVIVCAGQEPLRVVYDDLIALGVEAHLVGGAFEAVELDAKRAIDQATRLAAAV